MPKFPATTRDLSLICDDNLPAASIEKAIKKAAGKVLEKVTLFDVYKGETDRRRKEKYFLFYQYAFS